VLLLGRQARGPAARRLGLLLAIVPGLLGLAEYVLHVRLGIDELPFVDHDGRAAHERLILELVYELPDHCCPAR
jgi:hypothetical protein